MDNNPSKILIVDDRVDNLLLSNFLTKQGYKVQTISGKLALNAAIASIPDLILLNILMPEISSYEVCQTLKANSKTREIPIIFLSDLREASEKVKALELNGVDYITKPFQVEEVLARIRNQLTIQKLSAQLQYEIETRKKTEERLRLLESVVVNANDAVIITNVEPLDLPGPRIVYVNEGFTSMTGYSPEEVIGKTPRILQGNKTKRTTLDRIRQALESWQSVRVELINYRKDGSEFWVELEIVPVANEIGWFTHWVSVQRDITERKQVEIEMSSAKAALEVQNHTLEKAKLEAEAANRAKSQFLSKMSHELRTPLNAILGFTQLMAHDDSLTKEHKEHLEIINRSGEHLLELINDILSMSQIEAGQVTLNENCFDLYRLLDAIEDMLRLKANSKGLQLIFKRSLDLPQYIRTDESKLRQVLINLLGNAIKFTRAGSVTLRVSVVSGQWSVVNNKEQLTTDKEQLTIHFEVEDTGPGIDSDELSTVFNSFVQTQTGRQSMQGTGLGLAISRQFVRIMGGEIAVSTQLGRGAIFTFDIRVGLATKADEEAIAIRRRVIGLEPNQPTYRILVAEDAIENRQLLLKLLEPLGFEVREATNGQEAVDLWESWSPHLILMDILMPVIDGYEATQQIKRSLDGDDTLIIALTASAFEEQREDILRSGCDDFIAKPFREEILLEKIATHLRVRYIYEEEQPTLSYGAQPSRLMSEDLSVMPSEWVAQLHQAALCIDDSLIVELIKQIPDTQATLANALTDLVNNFRIDIIIKLTQPYISE